MNRGSALAFEGNCSPVPKTLDIHFPQLVDAVSDCGVAREEQRSLFVRQALG